MIRVYLFQVFFAVLIGAFALGQAGPNMEALFTAAGAAGTIYDTIDRVSRLTIYILVNLAFSPGPCSKYEKRLIAN